MNKKGMDHRLAIPRFLNSYLESYPEDMLLLILQHLPPLSTGFLLSCSTMTRFSFTSPVIQHQHWKKLLYSKVCDTWRHYERNILSSLRLKAEAHHGCYKIASAICSSTCFECGDYTTNINLLCGRRMCVDCWENLEKDEEDEEVIEYTPAAMCTVVFAKKEYLLKNSDMTKKLLVLNEVVLLANEAKKLSHEIYGGEEGLAIAKKKKAQDSKNDVSEVVEEEEKKVDVGYYMSRRRYAAADDEDKMFGYYRTIRGPVPADVRPASIFVTRRALSEVQLEHPGAAEVYDNLIEAVYYATHGPDFEDNTTICIEMNCDLIKMKQKLKSSSKGRSIYASIMTEDKLTIGYYPQDSILIRSDLCIIGSHSKIKITNDSAVFWVLEGSFLRLQKLRMVVTGHVNDEEFPDFEEWEWDSPPVSSQVCRSPCFFSAGISVLQDCELTLKCSHGYVIVPHGPLHLFDCEIRQFSATTYNTIIFGDSFSEMADLFDFRRNVFSTIQRMGEFDYSRYGFYFTEYKDSWKDYNNPIIRHRLNEEEKKMMERTMKRISNFKASCTEHENEWDFPLTYVYE